MRTNYRLLIATLALALCVLAPAQINNSVMVPGIKINKTKDNMEKKVKRGVILYMYDDKGEVFATRAVDMLPDPRSIVDRKYEIGIFIQIDNVFVEHLKVRSIPDPAIAAGMVNQKNKPIMVEQNVRGAANKQRRVFDLEFQELDIYRASNRKNAFGGTLDFSNCRLGDNVMEVVAFTKHAQQTEVDVLLVSGSSTTWRRNELADGMYFTVVDMPQQDLVVELARNGWNFTNPALDRQAKMMAQMPLMPPSPAPKQNDELGKGNGNVTEQGTTQKAEANATATGTFNDKLDRKISSKLNNKDFFGGTVSNGDTLEISSNHSFKLEVFRVVPGKKDELIKEKIYDSGVELKLEQLNIGCKYRIQIADPKSGRLVGPPITIEVNK